MAAVVELLGALLALARRRCLSWAAPTASTLFARLPFHLLPLPAWKRPPFALLPAPLAPALALALALAG